MNMQWSNFRCSFAMLGLAAAVAFGGIAAVAGVSLVGGDAFAQQAPTLAQQDGGAPGAGGAPANNLANTLGGASDSDIWRQVRRGIQGQVSIPNRAAGVLVQSEGDSWRMIRNGPLVTYGWWLLAAMCALLGLFFAVRGRIRVDSGISDKTIERFNGLERFAHWLAAGSFVVLALTGLNVLYGRYLFATGAGGGDFSALHTAFATITYYGKFVHNYIGFPFIIGVALMFVIWVRHNLLDRHDFNWIVKGGGLFAKGVHPPAGKFNFGQKAIFWIVVLSGVALFVTGLSMMFPFYWFGMQDMQLVNLIHAVVAIVVIAVMIAHIYIGSLGMEGAFAAMGTGQVDENWAREHHSVWVAEVKGEAPPGGDGPVGQPAE